MIQIVKLKNKTLRINHENEVNSHKIAETKSVQLEQDEAIAAVLEMLLSFLAEAEEGDTIEILSREDVTTICEQIIEKKVKNSVAAKVAVDLKKAIPDIVDQVVAKINGTETDENTAQEAEEASQETETVEPDEIIDESENASHDGAQSASEAIESNEEVTDNE